MIGYLRHDEVIADVLRQYERYLALSADERARLLTRAPGHSSAIHDHALADRRDNGADSPKHRSLDQGAKIEIHRWIASMGLDDTASGTHTMRHTKASLIYRRMKNLRALQLLLSDTRLESTVRCLGIEVDDALEMAEQTEV